MSEDELGEAVVLMSIKEIDKLWTKSKMEQTSIMVSSTNMPILGSIFF
jgi:hypothetical protein